MLAKIGGTTMRLNFLHIIFVVLSLGLSSTALAGMDVGYSVDEILSQYQTNAVAADHEFKNQKILIRGKVGVIGKNSFGIPYVMIGSYEDSGGAIKCLLAKSSIGAVEKLKAGDGVAFFGKFTGKEILNYFAQGCELVKRKNVFEIGNEKPGKLIDKDLAAPFDLKWDDNNVAEVKAALSGRLTFASESKAGESDMLGDNLLEFSGKFSGLDAYNIQMEFKDGKILDVAIMFDGKPYSKDLYKVAKELMESKYGKPSSGSDLDGFNWTFRGGKRVMIDVMQNRVVWIFMDYDFFKQVESKSKIKIEEKAKATDF
jgi:tRNA_anti-like